MWAGGLVAGLLAGGMAAAAGSGGNPADLQLLDLDGRSVAAFPDSAARGFVFLLVRTDCPVSNRYAPELQRLHRRFAPKGLVFRLVYPDASEEVEAIRRHVRDFGYPFAALRDPRHGLVRLVRATVTPEAAVFAADPSGPRLVYRGRIDDRYVDFGTVRAAPTTRDLEQVLDAVAAGRTVPLRTTAAVGCSIPPAE
jgi:hypothetical protein